MALALVSNFELVGLIALVLLCTAVAVFTIKRAQRKARRALEKSLPPYENTAGWNRIYLASYPRSGNHWARHLIEDATGLVTCSVGRDKGPKHVKHIHGAKESDSVVAAHSKEMHEWGAYSTPSGYTGNRKYPTMADPVIVKTHFPSQPRSRSDIEEDRPSLVVVRHPAEAIYSYYLYHDEKKRGEWSDFLRAQLPKWREFMEYWEAKPRAKIVRYEDMHADAAGRLAEILEHTEFEVSQADIDRAASSYPPKGALGRHLANYDEASRNALRESLKGLLEKYDYEV